MLHAEKQEGLEDNVTCMISHDRCIINMCGHLRYYQTQLSHSLTQRALPLVEASLVDPRLVTLAKSVACYIEAFSCYRDVDRAINPADREDDKP